MSRYLKLIALALFIVVLVAACGGKKAAPAAADDAAATSTTASASQPTATPIATPPGPELSGDDGEELSVSDRQAGLENLDSYRSTWKLEWKAVSGETSEDVSWLRTQEYTKEPLATHWLWTGLNQGGSTGQGTMEFWQIGTTSYIVMVGDDGQSTCMTSTDDDNAVADNLLGPQTLGSVNGARLVGTETLNGVRTRHYRYDEKSMALLGASRVSGDIWVAVDGGFVVKDAATWEGGFFGLGADNKVQGAGSWVWELTEVNQPLAIVAPDGCDSAATELPILPDATEQATFGDMVTYKTATKLADVVKFYQAEMPKAGWELEGEATTTDQFASFNFKKDGATASVMASVDNDLTNVILTIQKAE